MAKKNFIKIKMFLLSSMVFFGCAKVDVPNEQARLLIGSWEWRKTVELVAGTMNLGADNNIVFKDNGKYIERDMDMFSAHERYYVEASNSNGIQVNTIKYSKTALNTFRISNDSLYMYILPGVRTRIYIRKK